jgi:rhodanese-related sulfurtransferase
MTVAADMTMRELLEAFPGAQRALFRNFHIGGCASCGFQPDETLSEVCRRNDNLAPEVVLDVVRESHSADERVMIEPAEVAAAMRLGTARLLDIRTREEFEAVRIAGAELFSQDLLQSIMTSWDKAGLVVIVDHLGQRSLDAAAYLAGHGFSNVRCLRGGIDTWSQTVDPSLPRYTLE